MSQDTSGTPNEFELIRRFFHHKQGESVRLGPGDDAAIVMPPAGHELVMTQDTCVDGVHFPSDLPAFDIGFRSLAVNLSDLAAMGADPLWFLLSITLPSVDTSWLADFSQGLFSLADASGISLVGGDVTRGPLAISIQATGAVPQGQALRRDGAQVGDAICLGGVTGAGLLGLQHWQRGERDGAAVTHFCRPQPQLALGRTLRQRATACLDVSDGLLADLNHLLDASGQLGATLFEAALPLDTLALRGCDPAEQRRLQLQGGDDYVLLFTLPADTPLPRGCFSIGVIDAEPGLRLQEAHGACRPLVVQGWQHF